MNFEFIISDLAKAKISKAIKEENLKKILEVRSIVLDLMIGLLLVIMLMNC